MARAGNDFQSRREGPLSLILARAQEAGKKGLPADPSLLVQSATDLLNRAVAGYSNHIFEPI